MNAIQQVCLGPFFTPRAPSPTSIEDIEPLGVAIEWATPAGARAIELFRHRPKYRRGEFYAYQQAIVFRHRELPFQMDCLTHTIVRAPDGDYLPLAALLATLYDRGEASAPILPLLREVEGIVPQHVPYDNPTERDGMLVPAAESAGFRILNPCPEPAAAGKRPYIFISIGWRPHPDAMLNHAAIAAFNYSIQGEAISFESGRWEKGLIGFPELLKRAISALIPNPIDLFSPAGFERIRQMIRFVNQPKKPRQTI